MRRRAALWARERRGRTRWRAALCAGRSWRGTLAAAALLSLAALFLLPVVLTFVYSLMPETEIAYRLAPLERDPSDGAADPRAADGYVRLSVIPDRVTLSQYYRALIGKPQFLVMFWNSVKLAVPVVIGQTIVAALAAYTFALLRFRFREPLFFAYIVTMLMPFQVTLVPNFIVADRLGLLDTFRAIVLPGVFGAFGVFLLRQYMTYIPRAYLEAARVDGCGYVRTFLRIVLTLSWPGMASLGILVFIDHWNLVEQPLVFLHDAAKQPLSVYLSAINAGKRGIAFAAGAVYMLPTILLMLYAENELVEGIQLSGIKG